MGVRVACKDTRARTRGESWQRVTPARTELPVRGLGGDVLLRS